jgi:putative nucleotidyltransferase with HDIG domain
LKREQVSPGHFDKENKTLKLHVSELKIGMFVSKLDRDWTETPFLLQGFIIEHMDDITVLDEYCEYVWIDAVEDVWIAPEKRAVAGLPERKVSYINKIPAQEEHRKALGAYRQARTITKSLLDDIRLGGVIDTKKAKDTVNTCVSSVIRNPDALVWMSKMRDKSEYTSEHCLNVCILAIAFGRHLGMDEDALQKLGLCGLLHDVGKMRVPDAVLNKPSSLTAKESKMMRAHVVHGRNLLMSSPGAYHGVVDVAYSHHEHVDGCGYPRKLKAAAISDFSRIIAIVDAFDAMTADRCYAPSMSSTDALKEIFKEKGKHFDDRLSQEFIKCIGLYPPGCIVELMNGMVAIVLEVNHRFKHLPRVIVVQDKKGEFSREHVISLADIESDKLPKTYLIQRVLRDGEYGVYIKNYREKGLIFGQALR